MTKMTTETSIDNGTTDIRRSTVWWWGSLLGVSVVVVLFSLMMSKSYIGHHSLDLDEAKRDWSIA
jgi:hypothetical protein